jgi:threonine dehydrogenase-like Zn-dependent dehydrogenase
VRVFDPLGVRADQKTKPISAWIYRYNLTQPLASERIGIEAYGDSVTVTNPQDGNKVVVPLTREEREEASRRIGETALALLGDKWPLDTAKGEYADKLAEEIKNTFTRLKTAETNRLKMQILTDPERIPKK